MYSAEKYIIITISFTPGSLLLASYKLTTKVFNYNIIVIWLGKINQRHKISKRSDRIKLESVPKSSPYW